VQKRGEARSGAKKVDAGAWRCRHGRAASSGQPGVVAADARRNVLAANCRSSCESHLHSLLPAQAQVGVEVDGQRLCCQPSVLRVERQHNLQAGGQVGGQLDGHVGPAGRQAGCPARSAHPSYITTAAHTQPPYLCPPSV